MKQIGKKLAQTEKVAISLPAKLLRDIDSLRKKTGESRSAVFRRAAQTLLAEQAQALRIREYIEGYQNYPETADEAQDAEILAAELLGIEPWDEDTPE